MIFQLLPANRLEINVFHFNIITFYCYSFSVTNLYQINYFLIHIIIYPKLWFNICIKSINQSVYKSFYGYQFNLKFIKNFNLISNNRITNTEFLTMSKSICLLLSMSKLIDKNQFRGTKNSDYSI
jgi:hypothetical protein